MVALSDVKRWNAAQLDEIFQTVQQRLHILTQSGDDFSKIMPVDGWSGPAADTASSAHHSLLTRIDKLAAGASVVAKAIGQAADAITGVQHAITNAEALAAKYGYRIAEDGTLIAPSPRTTRHRTSTPRTAPESAPRSPTQSPRPCAPPTTSTPWTAFPPTSATKPTASCSPSSTTTSNANATTCSTGWTA
ncbi:hypothetical protein [Amycolatopsis sp. Hca4]|uniref:hypothetical protein n=1 Tax=Amycolatopsis sp. Hca4 TaxID=2742131 RepID=UPI0015909F42|nr:hypothetical protein [Amycolatopsis sp. Hca4]QKV74175.1 hypothetical protein HUT10_10665 [Amycolatopsis sp. Hca4]